MLTKKELNSYIKICDKVFKEIKDLVSNHSKKYINLSLGKKVSKDLPNE